MSSAKFCDAYIQARIQHERDKNIARESYGAMNRAKAKMIDEMLGEETKSIKREDGVQVSLRKSISFSVTTKNIDSVRDWLVETVGDDEPFVQEVISKKALKDYLKKELEERDEKDFPEFLRLSTRPDVTVRGLKALGDDDDEKEDNEDEF